MKHSWRVFLVFCITAVLLIACPIANAEIIVLAFDDVDLYIEELEAFFKIRDFDSVIEEYVKLTNTSIDEEEYMSVVPLYQYAQAMIHLRNERLQEADRIFTTLYELDENFPEGFEGVSKAKQLMFYTQGYILEKQGEYKEAIAKYNEAGMCQDATSRILKLREILDRNVIIPDRITMDDPVSKTDRIVLSWKDSQASDSYLVSYAALNGSTIGQSRVDTCEFTAEGLLPNTEYLFTITFDDLTSETKTSVMYYSAKTSAPQQFVSDDYVQRERPTIMSFTNADITQYNIEKAIKLDKATIIQPSDDGKSKITTDRGKRQNFNVYYLHIKFNCNPSAFKEGEQMRYTLILRTENEGVYSKVIQKNAPNISREALYIPIDELLTQIFDSKGKWSNDTGVLELYVNDMYVDGMGIEIAVQ